ncbi:hypothetical protein DIPPA_33153 [Diplonema papillatum]|nr:hypothetical protein DIPPA_33153 [Diplonema papillatum]
MSDMLLYVIGCVVVVGAAVALMMRLSNEVRQPELISYEEASQMAPAESPHVADVETPSPMSARSRPVVSHPQYYEPVHPARLTAPSPHTSQGSPTFLGNRSPFPIISATSSRQSSPFTPTSRLSRPLSPPRRSQELMVLSTPSPQSTKQPMFFV